MRGIVSLGMELDAIDEPLAVFDCLNLAVGRRSQKVETRRHVRQLEGVRLFDDDFLGEAGKQRIVRIACSRTKMGAGFVVAVATGPQLPWLDDSDLRCPVEACQSSFENRMGRGMPRAPVNARTPPMSIGDGRQDKTKHGRI